MSKIFRKLFVVVLMFAASSCIHVEIKGAGVFKGAKSRNDEVYTVDVPPGLYGKYAESVRRNGHDGSKAGFSHLGKCGAQFSLTGIMIPIIPFWLPNRCESKGFDVGDSLGAEISGITLQLHYNGITYDPYISDSSVKFKIENFSKFKSATDKTLILHKRKLDGTIFTKELPFDWKIVTEVSGG